MAAVQIILACTVTILGGCRTVWGQAIYWALNCYSFESKTVQLIHLSLPTSEVVHRGTSLSKQQTADLIFRGTQEDLSLSTVT